MLLIAVSAIVALAGFELISFWGACHHGRRPEFQLHRSNRDGH
jgi:hypothetical protein